METRRTCQEYFVCGRHNDGSHWQTPGVMSRLTCKGSVCLGPFHFGPEFVLLQWGIQFNNKVSQTCPSYERKRTEISIRKFLLNISTRASFHKVLCCETGQKMANTGFRLWQNETVQKKCGNWGTSSRISSKVRNKSSQIFVKLGTGNWYFADIYAHGRKIN
jgi:hypothetical protein